MAVVTSLLRQTRKKRVFMRSSFVLVALCMLTFCIFLLPGHSHAFSLRQWQSNYYGSPSSSSSPKPEEESGSALLGADGSANTLASDSDVRPLPVKRLIPLCRGSRDKEPLEYTCKDQVDWGKCNETWLNEGDYCAEACGRCRDRIPITLATTESDDEEMNEIRSDVMDDQQQRMPDVGTNQCGGHITYEWRIRTNKVKEASGLAASRLNDHVLWSHVDGWTTKAVAFLSDTIVNKNGAAGEFALQGQPILEFDLPHWVNKNPKSGRVDWEDISTAECPDGSKRQCLWISDTGNNKFTRGYSQVIAVVEPEITHVQMDKERRINTEYFTPNQVDKRNRAGLCQHGMSGSTCQHHQCKSDETNMKKLDFEEYEKTQPSDGDSIWVFTFKYPGKKEKDSEALVVAPDGSRFWLFEKNEEIRGANVYESDILSDVLQSPDYTKGQRYTKVDLFSIAFIQPPCIAAGTDCVDYEEDHLFSITGADIHPQGKSIALQTYKGPFVYEFESDRPFDISGMQDIVPRPVLHYRDGWGAEAIAYSKRGERLWQMPEENRHDGCQKVLVMDCSQLNLPLVPPPQTSPALQVRSDEQAVVGVPARNRSVSENANGKTKKEKNPLSTPDLIDLIDSMDEVLDESVQKEIVENIEKAQEPLVCEVIPNGWGTEKNLSIPICGGPDRSPPVANSTEVYNCEDQAAWGKCEESWLVEGNYCMGACGRCTHTTCTCPDCKKLKKPELLCNANQVVSSTQNASKLVIFDFDDTIKLHHPARAAPEALWAVEETIRLGYGIAIASASCHTDYLRKFLAEFSPEIFTPELLFSNAFQTCQKKKTGALKCTLAHYNLLDKPECSVFFDDSISNEKYADEANIKMIEVKKGVGVTKEKFRQGLDHMMKNCGRPKEENLLTHGTGAGECDPKFERAPPGQHTCKEQFRWGKCDETWMVEGHFCDVTCNRCNATTTNGGIDGATMQQHID